MTCTRRGVSSRDRAEVLQGPLTVGAGSSVVGATGASRHPCRRLAVCPLTVRWLAVNRSRPRPGLGPLSGSPAGRRVGVGAGWCSDSVR